MSKYFFSFYDKYKNVHKDFYARAFTNVGYFGFAKYPKSLKGSTLENILTLTIESFAVHTKYLRKDFIIITYHDEFKGLRY